MLGAKPSNTEVEVAPLADADVADADRIFRLAFATFLGIDPQQFHDGRDVIRFRRRADPEAVLAAKVDGKLIGSNVATNWGSLGFFGPLTVDPEFWNRGVAQRLLTETMLVFDRWQTRRRKLFTFANSAKHVALYQKFGFWPGCLTAIGTLPVTARSMPGGAMRYSQLQPREREAALSETRALCDTIYPGLDLSREIESLGEASGDVILLSRGDGLEGFAVCHAGLESEASANSCYVKFAAVAGGGGGAERLTKLFDACEAFAAEGGAATLEAGVSTVRRDAYETFLRRGFRPEMLGLAMSQGDEPGYDRNEAFVIDDLR